VNIHFQVRMTLLSKVPSELMFLSRSSVSADRFPGFVSHLQGHEANLLT